MKLAFRRQQESLLKKMYEKVTGRVARKSSRCDSLNVTEEEPLNLCLTHSQTFVIVSPRSICMLANFSEAEF